MPMFIKKPVIIEAVQFISTPEGFNCVRKFANHNIGNSRLSSVSGKIELEILTLEDGIDTYKAKHIATEGDWIIKGIKGIKGEFYACKPDIFDLTYSLVN